LDVHTLAGLDAQQVAVVTEEEAYWRVKRGENGEINDAANAWQTAGHKPQRATNDMVMRSREDSIVMKRRLSIEREYAFDLSAMITFGNDQHVTEVRAVRVCAPILRMYDNRSNLPSHPVYPVLYTTSSITKGIVSLNCRRPILEMASYITP